MAVLQAYQAYLLKELDEGEGINAEEISELRKTADLPLRATKETTRAIGRSMAALVVAERHLWLTLSDIKDRDRVFLLDAPLSPLARPLVLLATGSSYREAQKESVAAGAVSEALGRGPRSLSRICGPSFGRRGLQP